MIRRIKGPVACLLIALSAVGPACADVNVERHGSENPMQEIAKSTIFGGLAGLLLGGAYALADDSGDDSDALKWGVVAGTFFGFAYGFYHVQTRPRAMLEIEDGEPRLGAVAPTIAPDGETRLHLVGIRF
jgi:hypothetical protein